VQATAVKRRRLETYIAFILAEAIVLIFCAGFAQTSFWMLRYLVAMVK
jgi:hypothetical protein